MEIGIVLRESRIKSKMTVEQVSKILTKQGYKASQKTVYSWESGNSRPDIEILMKLCDLYGIKDILKTFGYDGYKEDGSLRLNMKEVDMVEKYRNLDDFGKKRLDYELDMETERVKEVHKQKQYIESIKSETSADPVSSRIITYFHRIASAGSGEYLFDDMPTDLIKVKDTPISREADFVIGVNGDSMEPDYYDGEKVFVKKCPDVKVGEVGIFLRGNECFIKECGHDGLISKNPKYPDIEPYSDGIKIVGKVVGKAVEID